MRLTSNAIFIRGIFKKSNDPNRLIFNDLPALIGDKYDISTEDGLSSIIKNIRVGLTELVESYGKTLNRFEDNMLAELQVPNNTQEALAELRDRAKNIRQLAGDHRLNAFITRISSYEGSKSEIEGLLFLAAGKPPEQWVDSDIDTARLTITELAQLFNKTEILARVNGRKAKRHAVAVILGIAGRPTTIHKEFDIIDGDIPIVNNISSQIQNVIGSCSMTHKHLILAALAQVCARYINDDTIAK